MIRQGHKYLPKHSFLIQASRIFMFLVPALNFEGVGALGRCSFVLSKQSATLDFFSVN
jgi:hypothetical protein